VTTSAKSKDKDRASLDNSDQLIDAIDKLGRDIAAARDSIGRCIFGQAKVIEETLITILAGGGMTLEGVRYLRKHTSLGEFHVGAAVRIPATLSGAVSAKQVAWFRRASALDGP